MIVTANRIPVPEPMAPMKEQEIRRKLHQRGKEHWINNHNLKATWTKSTHDLDSRFVTKQVEVLFKGVRRPQDLVGF